jgi:hypothetical protein
MISNYSRPVVVVPVHKEFPSAMEIVSLYQCGSCLARHDIIILAPEGIDLGHYHELMPVLDEIRVPSHCMASIKAYNNLMISPLVYQAVRGYTHMLIHEPDAIVLNDELDHWCSQPHDYIGAPWFAGYAAPVSDAPVIGVGNFGLSLRKVDVAIEITESKRKWYPSRQIVADLVNGIRMRNHHLFSKAISGIGLALTPHMAWNSFEGNCDLFWCDIVPQMFPDFRLATSDEAMRFAWEVLPNRCYEICEGRLPFGIHAWARYDLPFLLPHFKECGVTLDFPNKKISKVLGKDATKKIFWDLT